MMIDWLMCRSEEQQSEKARTAFDAWWQSLSDPPEVDITDFDVFAAAVMLPFAVMLRTVGDQFSSRSNAIAVEDAPAGWDNASLLADMQRAARQGG